MKPVELHRQIFRDSSHWEHGLSYKLRHLDGGGVALFSRPAFTDWATRDDAALGAGSLAVDDCGRLFWIHERNCQLYRRDPVNELVEPMIALAECDDDPRHEFGRMLTSVGRLWILDYTGSRLLAIRPDTFQIIGEIPLKGPVDVALGAGRLFTLDAEGIRAYDIDGRVLGGPYRERLSSPVALGVGSDSRGIWIYVVDEDARGFLRYSAADGTFDSELGTFDDAARGFKPQLLLVHPDGNLFVSDGSPVAHEFAPDGGYVGDTGDVSPLSEILGLVRTASCMWDLLRASHASAASPALPGTKDSSTRARWTTARSTTKGGTASISRRSSTLQAPSTSPTPPPVMPAWQVR